MHFVDPVHPLLAAALRETKRNPLVLGVHVLEGLHGKSRYHNISYQYRIRAIDLGLIQHSTLLDPDPNKTRGINCLQAHLPPPMPLKSAPSPFCQSAKAVELDNGGSGTNR